jgi:uncharacterized lipoprotein YmbA
MKRLITIATLLLAGCGPTTQLVSEIVMPEAPEILNRTPAPLKSIRSVYPEKIAVEPTSPITPEAEPK